MSHLTYENLEVELPAALPELRDICKREIEAYGNERPWHMIISMVLIEGFVIPALQSDGDLDFVERAFSFIERMADSPDDKVVNIVYVTICERLIDDSVLLSKAQSYMGEHTKKICVETEKWWDEAAKRYRRMRGKPRQE